MRHLRNIGRLFTGTQAGVIEKAAIISDDDEHIAWCGREGDEPRDLLGYVAHDEDCGGGLVTAGLIDAHTHPVYAGNRMAEIAIRSAGASYEEIAKAGGGIVATVKATREAGIDSLEQATAHRLRKWLEGGATTVEAKTGYHLEREGELAATRMDTFQTTWSDPSAEVAAAAVCTSDAHRTVRVWLRANPFPRRDLPIHQ